MFGRAEQLTIWSDIERRVNATGVQFFVGGLQAKLGEVDVHETSVWKSVRLLEELGMVRRLKARAGRPVWYERVDDSPGWDLVRVAVQFADEVLDPPD